ncbi:glucose-1-phosphate thymidylyltransferase RfbA [Candidatus Ponderosibacter sp. Uisw_141_02]|uniref:glucose-1-phosphate thymidylyltransferase RfbA n=1 Tax=Candidatus Ponderosibacter sp. Uisw_141_02 TaxID=3231000 RepID=UPI003D5182D0
MKTFKGILLAGGNGTRLYPLTSVMSKQLLPVYDKPMIYYPLSVLMLAGIRDILVITRPEDESMYSALLQDGAQWGVNISYATQPNPGGVAEGLLLGETFLDGSDCVYILGDNVFYGAGLSGFLTAALANNVGATCFTYSVSDPERYGVVELDEACNIKKIVEKPVTPPSNYAVTGLYVFDKTAPEKAKKLIKSHRGELEIVDVLNLYLRDEKLTHQKFNRGVAWLDTGTPESLLEAALFVETIEKRQGYKIACLEEIALKNSWVERDFLKQRAEQNASSSLGQYLLKILEK